MHPPRLCRILKVMNDKIVIAAGGVEVEGTLNDSLTAAKIREALPITARANLWGEENYFSVALKTGLEDGKEGVGVGDGAYWPEGPALGLFMAFASFLLQRFTRARVEDAL